MTGSKKPSVDEPHWEALHFYGVKIQVAFDTQPLHSRRPHVPDRFQWQDTWHVVTAVHREWQDFTRRGRMARNMRATHLKVAGGRGSWGVGRFYFRVETDTGRYFDLYYDRAPESASDRKGHWFLWREMSRY